MDPLSKNESQIFERRCGYNNIEQNVKDSSIWASCIAGILKQSNPKIFEWLVMLVET